MLVPTLESYDRRTRMWERLARWGVPRARRILLPSRAAPDLIAARIPIPARRVRVVPDSVSLEALHDLWPVEGRSRYLLLAAAPERHKNVSILVECLPLVEDRELEVWVAGTSLLDPGHRLELERRGRARAAEFSWARSVARLCEVLQEAAGG